MNETLYRIRIRKGSFEVEIQGDKKWVEEKYSQIVTEDTLARTTRAEALKGMPNTLVEFLDQKGNPKRHTELVAAFVYWLFKVEKIEQFNVNDIINCYNRTRRVKPSNTNQIVNTNVRSNVFAEATEKKEGRKAWILTRTGEQMVERLG